MTKFQAGDIVRFKGGLLDPAFADGELAVVTGVSMDAWDAVYFWVHTHRYPQDGLVQERVLEFVSRPEHTPPTGGSGVSVPAWDAVKSPSYYVMPNGSEVVDITQWLSSAGAQAVQYIARATRVDGVVKEKPIQDLEKAIFWLNVEIERLHKYGDA